MVGLVLRWYGGAGGDTLCALLKKQEKIYTNFNFKNKLTKEGKTNIHPVKDLDYPTLDQLDVGVNEKVDKRSFSNDLNRLVQQQEKILLKSTTRNKEVSEEIEKYLEIIEIGFNYSFLPFIVHSHVEKTLIVKKFFNLDFQKLVNGDNEMAMLFFKISKKISNEQKKKIVIWGLIKDIKIFMTKYNLANSPIKTQDLFFNPKKVEKFFLEKGFKIDLNDNHFIKWKKTNSRFLPSKTYINCLKEKKYDYNNLDMTLIERYILLELTGKKFQFL